jgi:hypothetical protein
VGPIGLVSRVEGVGVVDVRVGSLSVDTAEFTNSIKVMKLQSHENKTATSGWQDNFGIINCLGFAALTE